MIARVWHGSTRPADAGRYEAHLNTATLPGLTGIAGYRGAYVLRRPGADTVDFVVMTLWESVEAIQAFAGADVEAAVLPSEARAVLVAAEPRAVHYEIVVAHAACAPS
ncbi:MAG: antibiotic biosynthesis monooxygenase [Acidobacteriota bacterium]|nr:antibiotic biosynthesis monooxygenase [Acidobacteriota bacterium]